MRSSGAAVPCPGNDCGPRTVYVDITSTSGQRRSYGGLTNPFAAYADGRSGFGQPFKDAFDEAVDRLKKRKDCAKLFGGLERALATLNTAIYRLFDEPIKTTYKDGKFVPSVTGAMTA
jgi:hypothetical protein